MDDRTVTLHIDDWKRCKAALNLAGASTGAIDKLIDSGVARPSLTRPWEWWSALIDKLGDKNYGLTVKIIGQCSRSGYVKPETKPEKHEVQYATKYLEQEDDRELPDYQEIDETT